MWDLIVSVPDHCLSFYFSYCSPSVRPYALDSIVNLIRSDFQYK